jgi:hypothetical protein
MMPEPLAFNQFCEDNPFYDLILNCYMHLSPENLTGDGELPRSHVNRRRTELNRKLRGLFMAVGREISEDQAIQWNASRQESIGDRARARMGQW